MPCSQKILIASCNPLLVTPLSVDLDAFPIKHKAVDTVSAALDCLGKASYGLVVVSDVNASAGASMDMVEAARLLRPATDCLLIAVVLQRQSVQRLNLRKALLNVGVDFCINGIDSREDLALTLSNIMVAGARTKSSQWCAGCRLHPVSSSICPEARNLSLQSASAQAIEFFQDGRVTIHGQTMDLTSAEIDVLKALAGSRNQVVLRERLIALWSGTSEGGISSVISRLRAKIKLLDINGLYIRTQHGEGYSLVIQDERFTERREPGGSPEQLSLLEGVTGHTAVRRL